MNKKIKKMLLLELGIVFLVLIIFTIVKSGIYQIMPKCIINSLFGIQCPSCGGTRCIVNLALGNFEQSFYYNQIFFITIIYLFFVNIIYIINSFRKKEILTFFILKLNFG